MGVMHFSNCDAVASVINVSEISDGQVVFRYHCLKIWNYVYETFLQHNTNKHCKLNIIVGLETIKGKRPSIKILLYEEMVHISIDDGVKDFVGLSCTFFVTANSLGQFIELQIQECSAFLHWITKFLNVLYVINENEYKYLP